MDYNTIFDILGTYIAHPQGVVGVIKVSQYLGMTIGDGSQVTAEFWSEENAAKNIKAYIRSYCDFVQSVDGNAELETKYPETKNVLVQSRTYNVTDASAEEVYAFCWSSAFQPVLTAQDKIYITKSSLKPFAEYMRAIALGDASLSLVVGETSGAAGVEDLYKVLFPNGDASEILENTSSMAYATLAFYLKLLQDESYRAKLFSVHYTPEWMNETAPNKFWRNSAFYTMYMVAYPALEESKTVYWHYAEAEWNDERIGSTLQRNLNEPNPDSFDIDSLELYYPTYNGSIAGRFYGYGGLEVSNVAVSALNTTANTYAVRRSELKRGETKTFGEGYWQEDPGDYANVNTWSGGGVRIDEMHLDCPMTSTEVGNAISAGGLVAEEIKLPTGPGDITVTAGINPGFLDAYQTGTVEIVDQENGTSVTITLPDDQTSQNIADGTANVTDIMNGNGNYTLTDTGGIVQGSGSTSTETPDAPNPDTDPSGPDLSVYTMPRGLITTYVIDRKEIQNLGRQLFDPTLAELIRQKFSAPMDAILSLKFSPYMIPGNQLIPSSITIGGYDTHIEGSYITQQYLVQSLGDPIEIPASEDFYQFEPYADYKIFIPFSGWYDLPAGSVVGHTLKCQLRMDMLTGDTVVYVRREDSVLLGEYTGAAMRDMPVSQSSSGMLNAAMAAGALAVNAAGAAAGPAGYMVSNAVSGAIMPTSIAPTVRTNGKVSGNVGFMGSSRTPYVMCRYKRFTGSIYYTIGRRLNLSDIRGYVEANQLHNNSLPGTITDGEWDEIEQMFSRGVYMSTPES